MKDDEVYVTCNIAGAYKWDSTNFPNVLQSTYNTGDLTLCSFPQDNLVDAEPRFDNNYTKWFTKTEEGWMIKHHDDPCYGCGNPWCMLNENRSNLKELIANIGRCKRSTNKQKRYRCYRDTIALKYGTLGYQQMQPTGWCFENAVRVSFLDLEHTGYKPVMESGVRRHQ